MRKRGTRWWFRLIITVLALFSLSGGYRHQAHTVLEKPTPLCNLYLELLHKFNIDQGQFGSSKTDMGLLKT